MTNVINFFCRNKLQKIMALFVAFLMWIFVMEEQDPEIEDSYVVPLTISNTPYEFRAVCNEKTVTVVTRAPRSNFIKYNANAFRVYANVEGLGEGDYNIVPKVDMPQGFELVEIQPATVSVKLDPLIERQMPVEIVTTGSIASDSAVKEIRNSMDIVTVVGPKSFAEKVVKVYGMVNLAGNESSFDVQIPLNAVDDKGNTVAHIHVVPSVITVSVNLESGLKTRIVPVVAELTVAEGWILNKVTVTPEQMEITGAESAVNSVITLKTVPFTVQTGQRLFNGTLKLELPEGVTAKNDEVTVSAEVVRKPVMRE